MYESHFGLTDSPFAMSPDPRFLFFTPSHREALAGLMYGILNRKGFVSLIGDAGTGKTTLLRRTLDAVNGNKSLIVNPSVAAADFTKLAMAGFGIEEIPASRADQFLRFEKFLSQARADEKPCVLVVDEAQRLSPGVLEEIRMLTNFELSDGKLLQIVLAGQSELRHQLNRPDLAQLKQRIAMRLTLKPLSGFDEVRTYVRHRWLTAGGSEIVPFSDEGVRLVARYSTGVPRIVNALCDNALLLAFAEGSSLVSVGNIKAAASDLDSVLLPPPVEQNGLASSNGAHPPQESPAPGNARPLSLFRPGSMWPKLERFQPVRVRRRGILRWFAKVGS